MKHGNGVNLLSDDVEPKNKISLKIIYRHDDEFLRNKPVFGNKNIKKHVKMDKTTPNGLKIN